MEKAYEFHISGGLTKTDEVIRIARKLRTYGKRITLHAYDTVQGMQWNGGRLIFNDQFAQDANRSHHSDVTIENPQLALERVARLNDEGISFNLTFNNTLESIDLDDEVGNYLLARLHNDMNSVTVATESLRRHVASNFPKYNVIASICMVLSQMDECVEACKRFDEVVMLPIFAYQPELLPSLPLDKLIFLINDLCHIFCLRKDHYDYISRCSLSGNSTYEEQMYNLSQAKCFCRAVPGYGNRVRHESDREVNARVNRIWQAQLAQEGRKIHDSGFNFNITETARRELIRTGVTKFKLQGRDWNDADYQRQVVNFLESVVEHEL